MPTIADLILSCPDRNSDLQGWERDDGIVLIAW